MDDTKFQKAFEDAAINASNAFDSPKAIAEYLVNWTKKFFPERLATAYWIDVKEKKQDKGFDIKLVEFKMSATKQIAFRVGGLVGAWSAGLNLSTMFYAVPGGIKAGVGIGAVVPYDHIDKEHIAIVPSIILRF